jgi:hypothetical protein
VRAIQAITPYGDMFFLASSWVLSDPELQPVSSTITNIWSTFIWLQVRLHALGDLHFDTLNTELANAWSMIVQDIGERERVGIQAPIDAVGLNIDWETVCVRLMNGLRLMGYDQFMKWFGQQSYNKREHNEAKPSLRVFRPVKKVKTSEGI